jgi:hypothetical protein
MPLASSPCTMAFSRSWTRISNGFFSGSWWEYREESNENSLPLRCRSPRSDAVLMSLILLKTSWIARANDHFRFRWSFLDRKPALAQTTSCSRAVVAIGSDWLAFNVSSLAAARTALPLPGPFRGKFASAAATWTETALTTSRQPHASPHALRGEMTHLLPLYVLS